MYEKNDLFFHCQTKSKELSNIPPVSYKNTGLRKPFELNKCGNSTVEAA